MRIRLATIAFGIVLATPVAVHASFALVFPEGVQLETGDTWTFGGSRYRLFGVQACIRGTEFRNERGMISDCGMQSLAPLAALFSTGTVACQSIGRASDDALFVVCAASLEQAGVASVDVGTALISTGYAFAAVSVNGEPVDVAYLVAEQAAKAAQRGLWRGRFLHPVRMLLGN